MQNDIAISVSNVSKKYIIGKQKDSSFRGALQGVFNRKSIQGDEFMALSDLNFEIKKGEVLGIIGKNGAGKSTLLKILSQITKPSTGRIEINGRVASLLEVGTGFHPELTGRENIYLNGTILGMSRKEVSSKFDEIVEFSGVEKFIDTPVKHYSSGMYVRLAFAVAAHLEPEILIIDEVLAVGDAEFQKKCLGKMKDVAGEGRTVIFVSHNMAAVKTLCNNGLVLVKGIPKFIGSAEDAVGYYFSGEDKSRQNLIQFDDVFVDDIFKLNTISVQNTGKGFNLCVEENLEIEICTSFEMLSNQPERYVVTYHLFNEMGEAMFSFSSVDLKIKNGENNLICKIPANFFQAGEFTLSMFFVEDKKTAILIEKEIMVFTIVDSPREFGVYMGKEPGYIRPNFNWENRIV